VQNEAGEMVWQPAGGGEALSAEEWEARTGGVQTGTAGTEWAEEGAETPDQATDADADAGDVVAGGPEEAGAEPAAAAGVDEGSSTGGGVG
jgi:hypothetical protein